MAYRPSPLFVEQAEQTFKLRKHGALAAIVALRVVLHSADVVDLNPAGGHSAIVAVILDGCATGRYQFYVHGRLKRLICFRHCSLPSAFDIPWPYGVQVTSSEIPNSLEIAMR